MNLSMAHTMNAFFPVAQLSEIPDPGKQVVECDEQLVVLFHVDGEVYCLDDVCTHDGGPLGEGTLDGCAIICPRHGARFDIRTGKPLSMPATQPTRQHEVRVDGDQILVKLA